MAGDGDVADEPDLGALLARLLPRLAALEAPILQAEGLSMWEYAIVTELASGDAVSQVELSARTRRDPTRLGRHLDDLAARSIVVRERSADGRQRTVRLTKQGRAAYSRVKQAIRQIEDDLLTASLSAADARRLRQILARLVALD
ncbi:MarR family transcriptional regulator [Epidermidibacterium keratini]|uniref:MarR family transcriptional regulator n=1 Tax=Epidermidibacterium keratini TaxID=1891644 RepID=A0A7L4YPC5_9ACTN|nr:transcriptional regulator [Epidermidibacterium keratini]QHC00659.1 MarR family transcriptional regulator [Epidermidibacterium keratini]